MLAGLLGDAEELAPLHEAILESCRAPWPAEGALLAPTFSCTPSPDAVMNICTTPAAGLCGCNAALHDSWVYSIYPKTFT